MGRSKEEIKAAMYIDQPGRLIDEAWEGGAHEFLNRSFDSHFYMGVPVLDYIAKMRENSTSLDDKNTQLTRDNKRLENLRRYAAEGEDRAWREVKIGSGALGRALAEVKELKANTDYFVDVSIQRLERINSLKVQVEKLETEVAAQKLSIAVLNAAPSEPPPSLREVALAEQVKELKKEFGEVQGRNIDRGLKLAKIRNIFE